MLRRQLTLEDTPNDLQRGDLVWVTRSSHGGVPGVFHSFTESRHTFRIIPLTKSSVEDLAQNRKPWWNIPLWQATEMVPFLSYWVAKVVPYHPDLLKKEQQEHYEQICQLLGV